MRGPAAKTKEPGAQARLLCYMRRTAYCGGRMTLSITWITPLDARTSVAITLALSIFTAPPATVTLALAPCKVGAAVKPTTSAAFTWPATTWYSRMLLSAAGSLSRVVIVLEMEY